LKDIDLLQDFGLVKFSEAGDVKKVSGFRNIWELKTSCAGNIIYRTLFTVKKSQIIILNIFNKKEQKIRRQELVKAVKRANISI